jgi:hypothetical protein
LLRNELRHRLECVVFWIYDPHVVSTSLTSSSSLPWSGLVEMHGGRIGVVSAGDGQGSTFFVDLSVHQRCEDASLVQDIEMDQSHSQPAPSCEHSPRGSPGPGPCTSSSSSSSSPPHYIIISIELTLQY